MTKYANARIGGIFFNSVMIVITETFEEEIRNSTQLFFLIGSVIHGSGGLFSTLSYLCRLKPPKMTESEFCPPVHRSMTIFAIQQELRCFFQSNLYCTDREGSFSTLS